MNSRIYALIVAAVTMSSLSAQTSYDAVRFMGEDLNGTARYVGMGGAMGAFGNDISVISKNPAGIGTYVNNDVNVSFSFSGSSTPMTGAGTYNGLNVSSDISKSRTGMNVRLDNASFVLVMPTFNSNVKSMNLAVSYHNSRDIKRSLYYNDSFQTAEDYTVFRDLSDNQSLRVRSLDFNLSWNFNDSFYWGVTIGALHSWSNSEGYFYDYFPKQDGFDKPVDYTSFDRAIDMDGHGWNMKAGVIVRPDAGNFRMGLSVSTPTYYRVSMSYIDYLYALKGEPKDGSKYSQKISFNQVTPWTINASVGYSGARNAIGLEYEYNAANSTNMSISTQRLYSQGDTHDYRSYSTLRAGYETNISKVSLRCGYNYSFPKFRDDAYKCLSDSEFNNNRCDFEYENIRDAHTVTAGLGYCSAPDHFGGQYYIDLAYMLNIQNSELCVGEYSDDPMIGFRTKSHKVLITFGMTF